MKKLYNKCKRKAESLLFKMMKTFFGMLPLRKTVFFYTIRADGKLLENSKCVYDELKVKKVVFAKMLPHSMVDMPRMLYYLCTSKVIVTDDYLKYLRSVKLRPQQRVVQLWHGGGGFKCVGLDAPSKLTEAEERATHDQYTDFFITSDYIKKFYMSAFGIEEKVLRAFGSPRTDILFDEEKLREIRENWFSRHEQLRGRKIYVFLPTFREVKGERVVYDPKIDWEELDRSLNDDEFFVISRHPVMKYEYIKGKDYSHIADFTEDSTTELIIVADVIITDYSSIIFDYSLLGKPAVFYCPDIDEYERNFYLKYPEDLPGPAITDAGEILNIVRQVLSDPPTEQIRSFVEKEMSACDGHCTERIAREIESFI